jgi:hypothetical protein
MASPFDLATWGADIVTFLEKDVIPYLVVLAIAFVTATFALALVGRGKRRSTKKALRGELRTNIKVTKAIVAYADAQLSGDTSVAPMPRYRTVAFTNYVSEGLLYGIPRRIADELERIYLDMFSVNEAGRRQEELAFGPAAAFPNAHTLRLENLTYVRDTAHNIIEPYQDRLSDVKL